jgi:single-strand DNA-binding protein
MSLNLVQILGNLGSDVEIKTLPDGRAVGKFSVALGEKWKDKTTGEVKENTEWVRCVAFGNTAENIGKYFKKGSKIYLSGKLKTRSWDKEGVKQYITEVIVNDFQFCESNKSQAEEQQKERYKPPAKAETGHDDFDDDIPF